MDQLSTAEITLDGGNCDASAYTDGDEDLTCAASIDIDVDDGILKVAIQPGTCSVGNWPDTSGGPDERTSNDNVSASIDVDITASEISVAALNQGGKIKSVITSHCFRADFYPKESGSTSNTSAAAKKWDVTTNYTFYMEGDFDVEVTTEAFTPALASESTTRQVTVSANNNVCGVTASAGPYSINTVLTVCVSVIDVDVDIADIKDVKIQGISPEVDVVYANSAPSFVTVVSGNDTKEITIKTLLVSGIFDSLGGSSGTVTLVGTALLTYTDRRLSDKKRSLKEGEETAPFSIEIEIEGGDVPKIAQQEEMDGSQRIGVGIAAVAAAGFINTMI